MSPGIIAAVLLAAVLHAGWNTMVKAGADKFVTTALVCAGSAVVAFPFALVLTPPNSACYPYILVSAFIHVGYFVLIGLIYRTADLSVAYPLTRGSAPLITTLAAAILLHEIPSLSGLAGVMLLSGGILWLAADGISRGGLDRQSLAIAVLNAFVVAAYTIVDGQGGRLSAAPMSYNAWMETLDAILFLPVAFAMRGRALGRQLFRGWKLGLAGGVAAFAAYGIAIWAMTQAPIGLVAALRESSVVFAASFGALFLKEKFGAVRYAAAALVACGLAALRVA